MKYQNNMFIFLALATLMIQWKELWIYFFQKKIINWSYEEEYRIIYGGKDSKKEYNYDALSGIIFGIKTSVPDKLKIIKTIGKTHLKRNDFSFYQAYYCKNSSKIGIEKILPDDIIKTLTSPWS